MIHDETLPDRDPDDETEYERFERLELEKQGLVERDGVLVDAQRDWFTVSALHQRCNELLEHLRVVNAERNQAADDAVAFQHGYAVVQSQFKSMVEHYSRLDAICDQRRIEVEQLRRQSAELDAMRAASAEIRNRPLLSAGILIWTALTK